MKNSNKHSLYGLYKNLFTGAQEVKAGGYSKLSASLGLMRLCLKKSKILKAKPPNRKTYSFYCQGAHCHFLVNYSPW